MSDRNYDKQPEAVRPEFAEAYKDSFVDTLGRSPAVPVPISWEEARERTQAKHPGAYAYHWGGWRDGEEGWNVRLGLPHKDVYASGDDEPSAWLDAHSKLTDRCPQCGNPRDSPREDSIERMLVCGDSFHSRLVAEQPGTSAVPAPSVPSEPKKFIATLGDAGSPDEIAAKLEEIFGHVQAKIHDQWDWMEAHFYVDCLRSMATEAQPSPLLTAEGSLPPLDLAAMTRERDYYRGESARMRGELSVRAGWYADGFWRWEDDIESNHLESLTCAIVITPSQLRAALAAQPTSIVSGDERKTWQEWMQQGPITIDGVPLAAVRLLLAKERNKPAPVVSGERDAPKEGE